MFVCAVMKGQRRARDCADAARGTLVVEMFSTNIVFETMYKKIFRRATEFCKTYYQLLPIIITYYSNVHYKNKWSG